MLLSAHNLTKSYGPHTVVDDVSLHLNRGETLGLVGESGSGKSTIARLLLRLLEPTGGRILYYPETPIGPTANTTAAPANLPVAPAPASTPIDLLTLPPRDLRRLRRDLAIVFQDPYAALNPRMTVRQILSEPFLIHGTDPGSPSPTATSSVSVGSQAAEGPGAPDPGSPASALARWGGGLASETWAGKGIREPNPKPTRAARNHALTARLHTLLAEVHLDPSALTRYPHEFSGGQRQRINIARALALRPRLLVLDEPVSALDVSVAAQIINLIRDLQTRHHLTCLFISHSMPLVRYLCHRVAVMQRGRIVETGPWQQVCDHPTHPYTQQLLSATPELPTPA